MIRFGVTKTLLLFFFGLSLGVAAKAQGKTQKEEKTQAETLYWLNNYGKPMLLDEFSKGTPPTKYSISYEFLEDNILITEEHTGDNLVPSSETFSVLYKDLYIQPIPIGKTFGSSGTIKRFYIETVPNKVDYTSKGRVWVDGGPPSHVSSIKFYYDTNEPSTETGTTRVVNALIHMAKLQGATPLPKVEANDF
ncbi:hypothetical protein [Hymenobacter tenuis]